MRSIDLGIADDLEWPKSPPFLCLGGLPSYLWGGWS